MKSALLLLMLLLASPAGAQHTPGQMTQEPVHPAAITTILGRPVFNIADKEVARVIDVLVDGDGEVRAAVLEFGGFMGVGQRRVAVAWSALRFTPADKRITLMLNAEQIAAMPEYKASGAPVVIVTPPPQPQ